MLLSSTLLAKPRKPDNKYKDGEWHYGDGEYPPFPIDLHLSVGKVEDRGAQYRLRADDPLIWLSPTSGTQGNLGRLEASLQ